MQRTVTSITRITIASALVMAVGGSTATATTEPAGGGLTVVASGLTNPRGFTWDADGNLVVALAGSGGPNAPTEDTPTAQFIGPFSGGATGAVATIDDSGCPSAVATGLPSVLTGTGEVLGAEDVAYIDGELYIGADGGGAGHGNEDLPSGVYRATGDGTAELVADLSTWVRENPVAAIPPDSDPDAAGYSLVVDPTSGTLWVDDPNSGQVLSVATDGTITRVADLSAGHLVPTRLALDPEGGVYYGILTTVPFADGAAGVFHLAEDGTAESVWSGLTTVVDVAVGPDGTLYALELSTGNLAEPPFLTPGSGRVVRQTGPDTSEVVLEGLMFPIAMEIGPDGMMYVSLPAIGANDGSGAIVSFDPSAPPADATMPEGDAGCAPIAETLSPVTDSSTPPDASAAPGEEPTDSAAPGTEPDVSVAPGTEPMDSAPGTEPMDSAPGTEPTASSSPG
jgi:hypothetical protein